MSPRCNDLQQLVADHGATVLQRDLEGQAHLEECAECLGFVEALAVIDAASDSLPHRDAPEELLQRTLDAAASGAVETSAPEPAVNHEIPVEIAPILRAPDPPTQVAPPMVQRLHGWYRSKPFLGAVGGLATAAFVVFIATDGSDLQRAPRDVQRAPQMVAATPSTVVATGDFGGGEEGGRAGLGEASASQVVNGSSGLSDSDSYAGPGTGGHDDHLGKSTAGIFRQDEIEEKNIGAFAFFEPMEDAPPPAKVMIDGKARDIGLATTVTRGAYRITTQDRSEANQPSRDPLADGEKRGSELHLSLDVAPTSEAWHYNSGYEAVSKPVVLADKLDNPAGKRPEVLEKIETKRRSNALRRKGDDKGKKDYLQTETVGGSKAGQGKEYSKGILVARSFDTASGEAGRDETKSLERNRRSLERVVQFMAERAAVEGLAFQAATGYWANSYVPGDPVLRLLQARLARGDRSQLTQGSAELPELDRAARPYLQSFDPPKTAALGLTVRADRRSTDGPARMLLQVGLKGTARKSGRRPAMNIGVVLDLRNASSTEARAGLRGLLSALLASKQVGDRFSLTIAGRPGGLVLTADDFKNGPLTVAMRQLFGDGTELAGATLSLPEALERASQEVLGTDDPTAPLGSSLTLLITAAPLDAAELSQLVSMAHANAVDGIGLSAVGVGESVDVDQLTQLAAAGQGNRRLLLQASDASGVIERELSAVGAVVARALRVRIKLAPGVKLVDVVGSRRLDVAGAQRARDAENAIDRRVARARGIAADRGNDEDGIQIIIPSFYSGDSHVILLDVVVDGPGPIADVTVRYKDLVFLGNGVARDSLELRRGEDKPGKIERGVFKNYVAHRVSMDLRSAGKALAAGDLDGAAQQLASLDELLTGLPSEVPSLAKDQEFSRDAAMVAEYLDLLIGGNLRYDGRPYVADSLRYAGWRKLVPVRDESK